MDNRPKDDMPKDGPPGDGAPAGSRWEPTGVGPVPPELAGSWRTLPDEVFVLFDPARRQCCFRKLPASEDIGLLAWSGDGGARAYAAACLAGFGYTRVCCLSLAAACAAAVRRHALVNCVILMDDPGHPLVQYVR